MKQVIVDEFGPPQVLQVAEVPTPEPGPGQVRVAVTSIGLNHAELMARRGEYKLASGDPPFTPGIEAGGVIDALGDGVTGLQLGQRVIVGVDAPRAASPDSAVDGGTYRSHYVCAATQIVGAPDAIPDEQLGAIWLAYLTAWGCLIWKQRIQPGQIVAMPAASSSVALAAAQIVKHHGGTAIGLTRGAAKAEQLQALPTSAYDHLIVTHDDDGTLHRFNDALRAVTAGHGVDLFFDPVAGGAYLATEVRALATGGTIWIYGLLDKSKDLNIHALIRQQGAIRGWMLAELTAAGATAFEPGYRHILEGFASGVYRQHVGGVFKLEEVAEAHRRMEQGKHIGKLVLVP